MKKKSVCILLIFAAVIVLTYVTGESYYRGISEKAGLDKQEEKIYKYQYDMIVDSPDSQFWQAVYDSAKKKAAPNNVLIEIMGPDRETSYDKLDYMNMSIAAKADGIILQYNGEAGLEEAIDTAVRNGIPVVTVMSDAVHSRRQSFLRTKGDIDKDRFTVNSCIPLKPAKLSQIRIHNRIQAVRNGKLTCPGRWEAFRYRELSDSSVKADDEKAAEIQSPGALNAPKKPLSERRRVPWPSSRTRDMSRRIICKE